MNQITDQLRCYQCHWHCGFTDRITALKAAEDHLRKYPGHRVSRSDAQDTNDRIYTRNRLYERKEP